MSGKGSGVEYSGTAFAAKFVLSTGFFFFPFKPEEEKKSDQKMKRN